MTETAKKVVNLLAVGGTKVTLFFADGTQTNVDTSAEAASEAVLKIARALANKETEVLFDPYSLRHGNTTLDVYKKVEKKTGIRFIRVLKSLFGGETEPTYELVLQSTIKLPHHIPLSEQETIVAIIEDQTPDVAILAEDENEASHEGELKAVAEPKEPITMVPHFEKLEAQVMHVAKGNGNPEAIKAFLARSVNALSKHTIQELMDFLTKHDLPLTDDGRIIAYKRLCRMGDHLVDTHTCKVIQRVGSIVQMNASMVDPNRRNECSNGLHIGRRDYMSSFCGDVVVLVLINPEDVIAVPQDYSGAKMRTCRYQIVTTFDKASFEAITSKADKDISDWSAGLINAVIKGIYYPAIETVTIRGAKGTDLLIEPITQYSGDLKTTAKFVENTIKSEAKKVVKGATAAPKVKAAPSTLPPKKASDPTNLTKLQDVVSDSKETDKETLKKAKKLWKDAIEGKISKSSAAKQLNISTRSLGRWAEKYKW